MKLRLLLGLALLGIASLSFAQGSISTGNPIVTNGVGQPIAGAEVAICTANPGTSPAGLCTSTLATIYTDISLAHACTGTLQGLNNQGAPTVGSGCSNPGLSDGSGNVIAFTTAGTYWCEYTGQNIVGIGVQPCIFPASVGNLQNPVSIAFIQFPVLSGDAGANINNACALLPSTGGLIILPAGTGIVSTTITCGVGNVTIMGAGMDATLLTSIGGTLGANPVLSITSLANPHLTGFSVRNGTHQTTIYTTGKDGLDLTNNTNPEFDHIHFNEIEGPYGVNKAGNTNLKEHDNVYDNNTYCDSCNQGGNDTEYVWDNVFNSPTCQANLPLGAHPGNCPQIYSFASGNDATTRAFYSRNLFVWNNKASNAFWECYDAHGGDNINYFDNQGDNCAIGMAFQIAANGNITSPSGIGVHFDHNRINQGTVSATPVAGSSALPDNFGINVQGDGSTGKYTVKNWSEDYNQVSGYGSSPTDSVDSHSAIGWAIARDGEVKGNIITNYNQNCLAANTNTQDTKIADNICKDMVDYNAAATAAPFRVTSSGNYGLIFDRNTVEQNINTLAGAAGLPNIYRFSSSPSIGGIQGLETNIIKANPVTSYISSSGFIYYNQAAAPTNKFIVKMGDKIFNTAFQPGWTVCGVTSGSCSFTDTGYGSFNTTDPVVTVNMTSGTNTFTVVGNGTFNAQTCTYLCLPRGANIVIAGAGPGSANLSCKVTGVDNSSGTPTATVYTSAGAPCNASTTVVAANVTYQGAALWAFQVDGSGNVTATSFAGSFSGSFVGVPKLEYCGATTGATQACAKTQVNAGFVVQGDVLLNGAATQAITTLPFATTTYSCSGSDLTNAAGIVNFSGYNAASVTISESGGGANDHLRYSCVGN